MSRNNPQYRRVPVDEEDFTLWVYPSNSMVGKTIRLTQTTSIELTEDPDDVLRKLKTIKTSYTWAATEALCKYFYHEIKVHKNMIDDCQEQIRTQKARIKHLRKDCRIRGTVDAAYQRIRMLDALAEGCKSKRDKYMAENRRLRAKTPSEKYIVLFEDDREVIAVDDDDDERDYLLEL